MMNDRIKELAEQAMTKHFPSFDNIASRGQYSSSTYNRAIEEMMLVFAELIVRECITVCENGWQGEFTVAGIHQCVNDLKKHFGVEE